jgi:hypothetical protein
MNALMFMYRRSVANWFKESTRSVKRILAYLGYTIWAVIMLVSLSTASATETPRDIIWLHLPILLLFGLTFFVGRTGGAGNFEMQDVNLAFTSPILPRTLLLYGIVQSAKNMIFLCVTFGVWGFLLNMWMHPIPLSGVFLIMLGAALVGFSGRMLGLFVFTATSGKPKGQDYITGWSHILFAPMIIGAGTVGLVAFIGGTWWLGLLLFAVPVVMGLIFFLLVYRSNPDFYEDAHVSAHTQFENAEQLKEGGQGLAAATDKVRMRGVGLRGMGASVFFFKHRREEQRLGQMIGAGTIIAAACAAIGAEIINRELLRLPPELHPLVALLGFMMLFKAAVFCASDRGVLEIYSHYIYLMPERPIVKLVWANTAGMAVSALQGLIILTIPGFMLGAHPAIVAGAVVVYAVFPVMLLGLLGVFFRLTGGGFAKSEVLTTLFTLFVMLVIAPGIIAIFIVGTAPGLAILALWQALTGGASLAISRGIIGRNDMPNTER